MKKQYYLENLGCANCAAKMETHLQKQKGIQDAVIDFVNKKLLIESSDEMNEEQLAAIILPVVTKIEKDVKLVDWEVYKSASRKLPSPSAFHSEGHTCDDSGCHSEHEHNNNCCHDGQEDEDTCCRGGQEQKQDTCCHSGHKQEGTSSNADDIPHGKQIIEKQNHGHKHSHGGGAAEKSQLFLLIIGTLVGFGSLFLLPEGPLQFLGILAGYLIIGYEVLYTALLNILKGELFDENFLMAIATVGAFCIGEYPEALAVMILYQIGEYLQDLAVDKSRKHLTDAMNIKAEYANIQTPTGLKVIAPEDVKAGDIILVKPSERIPLDGIVVEGESFVDTSSLTGEAVPRRASKSDDVLSGCINGSGTLSIQVTKPYTESTVAKILDLVENASARKSPTENFITKFARVYTPIVVIGALLMALLPPIISGTFDFAPWIYKACGFLVVSCPCALVISVPLGFFGGIGCASKNGIVVKGSNYLEALNNVTYAVFDKTGTLTKGTFSVTAIVPENSFTADTLSEYAAAIESFSTHPIAKSIVRSCTVSFDTNLVSEYEEIAGHGIKAHYKGDLILLGNETLLSINQISFEPTKESSGTIAYLAINGVYAGYFVIADEIKEDSKIAVHNLKKLGIKTIMLTGDTESAAAAVAKELDLDLYYSNLLPGDKVDKIEELLSKTAKNEAVLFTGDGINDAPVLMRADVGVAMGGVGSDAAIEAADIVLMTDEPALLERAIRIARFTRKIVSENIVLSLGIKAIVLFLLAIGKGSMWLAVFADVGVAMIAILNSLRTLRLR